jgi:hypothetical protein
MQFLWMVGRNLTSGPENAPSRFRWRFDRDTVILGGARQALLFRLYASRLLFHNGMQLDVENLDIETKNNIALFQFVLNDLLKKMTILLSK